MFCVYIKINNNKTFKYILRSRFISNFESETITTLKQNNFNKLKSKVMQRKNLNLIRILFFFVNYGDIINMKNTFIP